MFATVAMAADAALVSLLAHTPMGGVQDGLYGLIGAGGVAAQAVGGEFGSISYTHNNANANVNAVLNTRIAPLAPKTLVVLLRV